jgi:hypothetical protein
MGGVVFERSEQGSEFFSQNSQVFRASDRTWCGHFSEGNMTALHRTPPCSSQRSFAMPLDFDVLLIAVAILSTAVLLIAAFLFRRALARTDFFVAEAFKRAISRPTLEEFFGLVHEFETSFRRSQGFPAASDRFSSGGTFCDHPRAGFTGAQFPSGKGFSSSFAASSFFPAFQHGFSAGFSAGFPASPQFFGGFPGGFAAPSRFPVFHGGFTAAEFPCAGGFPSAFADASFFPAFCNEFSGGFEADPRFFGGFPGGHRLSRVPSGFGSFGPFHVGFVGQGFGNGFNPFFQNQPFAAQADRVNPAPGTRGAFTFESFPGFQAPFAAAAGFAGFPGDGVNAGFSGQRAADRARAFRPRSDFSTGYAAAASGATPSPATSTAEPTFPPSAQGATPAGFDASFTPAQPSADAVAMRVDEALVAAFADTRPSTTSASTTSFFAAAPSNPSPAPASFDAGASQDQAVLNVSSAFGPKRSATSRPLSRRERRRAAKRQSTAPGATLT